jgi:hypothetical protein
VSHDQYKEACRSLCQQVVVRSASVTTSVDDDVMSPCAYHGWHPAVSTVVWPNGHVLNVCGPAGAVIRDLSPNSLITDLNTALSALRWRDTTYVVCTATVAHRTVTQ